MADLPPPAKKRFTRLRLIGCVLLLLLGGAIIIIPGILGSSRASNHRSAATSLKTLCTAEADFRANDRDWNKVNDFWVGDVSRLYYLESEGGPIKLIELSVASADGAPKGPLPSPGAKAGYLYKAIPKDENGAPYDEGKGRNTSKFAFCAYPEEYRPQAWYRSDLGITIYTFIINEENTIWRKDTGGVPPEKFPKNPLGEGWSKLD